MAHAVKTSSENGRIDISVTQNDPGSLCFAFGTAGPGIPTEQQTQLFAWFNRPETATAPIEGIGIGLNIAMQLAALMHGDLGMSRDDGRSSALWVSFPIDKAMPAGDASGAPDPGETALPAEQVATNAKVLYVEDNPANLVLMEQIITRIPNVTFLSARTAEAGLELAQSERPQLILLDINLPGMNGYEALAVLQENADLCIIPVVAVTAGAMPADIARGMKAGFRDYLTKPILVNRVIDVVRDFVGR